MPRPGKPFRTVNRLRRTLMLAFAGTAAELALRGSPWASPSSAATPGAGAASAAAAGNAVDAAALRQFVAFSTAITGHKTLDTETARRIYLAFRAHSDTFASDARRLGDLAAAANDDANALLAAASKEGLRDACLSVVAAWYTGTVGEGADATVVAYHDALMYQPVADGQSPPTYCRGGPAWWTEAPPAAGVSPPVNRPVTPAPTTGFPVPTTDQPAPPKTTPTPSNRQKESTQ